MATYTREGRFTPININSDPSATLAYNQQRLALQAKGSAVVKSQYQKLLDLELTHENNQEKLNSFFKDANDKLNQNVNIDLSDYSNVQQALNIFDPLSKSPEYESVRLDNQYTKHYKEEIGKAEYYRNKQNKEGSIGTGYSDYNYKELVDNYTKFKNNSGQDPTSWGDQYTYKAYYDYNKEKRELTDYFLKQADKYSQESMDANGITNKITYEGKSAAQLQKFLDNNMSAKAKDQILLEGRVKAKSQFGDINDAEGDKKFISFLKDNYNKEIKEIKDEITKLEVIGTDKTNKKYTPGQLKEMTTSLETQRKEVQSNLDKFNDPKELQDILSKKVGIYANFNLNNDIKDFSLVSANNRVSNELGSNSAFVQALNRQARLNEFVNEMALRQYEFKISTDLRREEMANSLKIALLNNGLGPDGKPLGDSGGLGSGKVLVTKNIKEGEEQVTREEQEEALKGGVKEVLKKVAPSLVDAFGTVGENPFEISKNHLREVVILSNKLQAGDKKILELLHSAPDKLSKQDRARQNILVTLNDNDDKIMAYTAYERQKKQTIKATKEQVLKELKSSGFTVDQINEKFNSWNNWNRWLYDEVWDYSSLETVADDLVNSPELAERFKGKMGQGFLRNVQQGAVTFGQAFRALGNHYLNDDNDAVYDDVDRIIASYTTLGEKIKNIGTEAQLKINRDLNNSYFSTQKAIVYTKPLDTETPASKAALSRFNVEVQKVAPYLPETDEDFNLSMVTGMETDNTGTTLTYQPSEVVDGKLVSTGDAPKTIRIDNKLVGLNINDQRDKVLLGTMTLGNGETPPIISKGVVPFKYTISTASGNRYSSEGDGQGGFVGRVIVGNKSFLLPEVYNRPTDIEKTMRDMSDAVAGAIVNDINYDLLKANKAPLTKAQKDTYMHTPEFMETFNNKMKDFFESDKIYTIFGAEDPNLNDIQKFYSQFNNQ